MMMISGGVDSDGDGVDDDGDVKDEMEEDVNDGCDTVRVMGLKRCSLWATRSTTIAIVLAIVNGDNFGKDVIMMMMIMSILIYNDDYFRRSDDDETMTFQ